VALLGTRDEVQPGRDEQHPQAGAQRVGDGVGIGVARRSGAVGEMVVGQQVDETRVHD
jgi:hypothetical protein